MRPFLTSLLILFALSLQAQSYQAIHERAILVDTHNDVLSGVILKGLSIEQDLIGKAHSDLARFKKGGVDVQVFSVFCDERFGKDTAFRQANIQIDSLMAVIKRNPSRMMLVTNPAQLQQAVKQHKLGSMIGVEGGHMIEDRLDYLDALYKRGARYLTLTWNNSTSWATSAADEAPAPSSSPQEGVSHTQGQLSQDSIFDATTHTMRKKGLTDFGKQIVRHMNEIGMLVDVSHLGEQSFWHVMATTTKPIIASHSSVYALCPFRRNLKDDQIRAIGKNGGVIQVNFYSGFIDSNYNRNKEAFLHRHQQQIDSLKALNAANYEIEQWAAKTYPEEAEAIRATLDQLLDHIDYIVKLIGADHVGLGSDFDGIESSPRPLNDVSTYPLITQGLLKRGYSVADINKILGGNFIRVFKEAQRH